MNLDGTFNPRGGDNRLQHALDGGHTEEAALRLLLGVARAVHAFAEAAPQARAELLALLLSEDGLDGLDGLDGSDGAPDLAAPGDR